MSTFATVTYICVACSTPCAVSEQMSGNNMGAIYWSDTRIMAPMLDTEATPFIQCPSCHKFFDMRKQEGKRENGFAWLEEGYSAEGVPIQEPVSSHLTLDTAQLLLRQLEEVPAPDPGDIAMVRRRLLLLANDVRAGRSWDGEENTSSAVRETAENIFREQAEALLASPKTSPFLKAELLRELGQFDDCLAALAAVPEDDGWFAAVPLIRKKAEAHDSTVFELQPDQEEPAE